MTNDILPESQATRAQQIAKLETEWRKNELAYKVKMAEHAAKEQRINFITSFIAERMRLEMLAMFGLIRLEK